MQPPRHGVGLSQTGAVVMAEKGATDDAILHDYCRGTGLTTWC